MDLTGISVPAEDAAASREARLSAWYDSYGTDVLRLCCFYLGSRVDGEDAAQETFLKAWRAMDGFSARHPCGPRTWLMKIAMNTCRDFRRKAWRRRETVSDDPRLFGEAPQPDRELLLDVTRLPEKQRAVILLTCLHRLTIRETARVLRVSPTTVHRRLEQAKALLART